MVVAVAVAAAVASTGDAVALTGDVAVVARGAAAVVVVVVPGWWAGSQPPPAIHCRLQALGWPKRCARGLGRYRVFATKPTLPTTSRRGRN